MEENRYQPIAIGAVALGIVAALFSGGLSRWLRVTLVVGLLLIGLGAGFYGYRWAKYPITLTVATAGSLEGDAQRLMSAIAIRIASNDSEVRLKVVSKQTAADVLKAFTAGEVDLAVARADAGDLSAARAVVTVAHAVVLLVVPPGSRIDSIEELKGKTVGVLAAADNQNVIAAISKTYELEKANVQFKDLALADMPAAFNSKQVQALLLVVPVSERHLSLVRTALAARSRTKVELLEIDAAEAIAALSRYYENYDLPKGTLRGSPPIPDEDLTTLRVPYYLLANKALDDGKVTALTKAVMEARRDLIGEHPILAKMSAPSKERDAVVPIHPGAAAYFDAEEKTVFDKYGDQFFYGSLLLGSLMSLLTGVWKFMTKAPEKTAVGPPMQIHALIADARAARDAEALTVIEDKIDNILNEELKRQLRGDAEPNETAALDLVVRRLEHVISERRAALSGQTG